jgi:hypothetical protein
VEPREHPLDHPDVVYEQPIVPAPAVAAEDTPRDVMQPSAPEPNKVTEEPVRHLVKKMRTKTIIEPGYMKLVCSGSGISRKVTLFTDMTETLKVIHRTAEAEDVALPVSVESHEQGLSVLEVDTGDLADRYELVVTIA